MGFIGYTLKSLKLNITHHVASTNNTVEIRTNR